jgi:LCP family protein required for cell wall assembly
LSIVLIAVGTVSYLWFSGKRGLLKNDSAIISDIGVEAVIGEDNTVVYGGKVYKYNENVTAILCMGIDNQKRIVNGQAVTGNAGQADALYLMSIDVKTGKTTVVGIPRDTYTDVSIYSKNGNYVGMEKKQICLAFSYGDGKAKSCENTVKSVSDLLYGMPINSYFALDSKAVSALHNAVGTITVVPNETLTIGTTTYYKGVSYKLYGSNVFAYLQARNQETADASYLRMERQLDYISKYSSKVLSKTKEDITFPVKLYSKVQKNAITNLDAGKISYLAANVVNSKETASLSFVSLKGRQIVGESGYAEFYPDEDNLFETMLKLYYIEQ